MGLQPTKVMKRTMVARASACSVGFTPRSCGEFWHVLERSGTPAPIFPQLLRLDRRLLFSLHEP